MRTIIQVSLMTLLAFTSFVHADLLTLKSGSATIQGVNIAASATAKLSDKTVELTAVGAGLRSKVVFLVSTKVYVAQLMVADPSRYVKTAAGALASLDQESAVAIRLTFVRDVPADKISTSFQDGLDANNVSSKDTDVVNFMSVVNKSGDSSKNSSLTILLTRNADGSITLNYENLQGGQSSISTIQVGPKMINQLLSIWLGNSADSGLADLKVDLLK